jgi:Flp pilus assembly protein TadD
MPRFSFVIVAALALLFMTRCKTHQDTTSTENPNAVTALDYVKKGNIQLDLKNYKDALTLLDKAIEMDTENGEAYAYRGMAKLQLKDYKGAVTDFDAAVKLIPDYGEVYDLRGVAKGELGDKVGACEDWNQAFALGFNNAYNLIEKFCIEETK